MPLTANCPENNRICSLDFENAHEIRLKYNKGSLTCPFCQQIVHPRQRENYIVHFVHNSQCPTTLEHHPESIEHLLGKAALAKHLKKQVEKYDVEVCLEYPIPEAGKMVGLQMLQQFIKLDMF